MKFETLIIVVTAICVILAAAAPSPKELLTQPFEDDRESMQIDVPPTKVEPNSGFILKDGRVIWKDAPSKKYWM